MAYGWRLRNDMGTRYGRNSWSSPDIVLGYRNDIGARYRGSPRKQTSGRRLTDTDLFRGENKILYGSVKKLCNNFGFIQPKTEIPDEFSGAKQIFFHFDVLTTADLTEGENVGFLLREGTEERPAAKSVWRIKLQKKGISQNRFLGTIMKFSENGGFLSVFEGDDCGPIRDVYFHNSRLRCAGFELALGDILECTLEPCKKGFANWVATGILLKEFRPRREETIVGYIDQTINAIESGGEKRNELILDILNFSAFWKLCGSKDYRLELAEAVIGLLLLLKVKAKFLQHAFKDALATFLNTELFRSKKTKLNDLWDSTYPSRCNQFQEFLSAIVELLPEKTYLITPFMRPIVSVDQSKPDNFLYRIVKKLSELNCKDVDDLDWNRMPLVPSFGKLRESSVVGQVLYPVKVSGPYENPDTYMDTYFRLLMADCFDGLQSGIHDFLQGQLKPANMNMYLAVTLKGVSIGCNNVPISLALKITPGKAISNWASSSNLMFGNLLCLSPKGNFEDVIWATVANRDEVELKEKQLIWVTLCKDVNIDCEARCISIIQEYSGKMIMAESPTYYNAYSPVLKALQCMDPETISFKEELVYNHGPLMVPERAKLASSSTRFSDTQEDSSDSIESHTESPSRNIQRITEDLDESQGFAFESCLDKRISVIQGPPGTGKTYLGIKLVEYFLGQGKCVPILVLTYKNHALDEFLRQVLVKTKKVVRVGGRGNDSTLAEYNLRAKKSFSWSHQRYDLEGQATEIKKNIQLCLELLLRMSEFTVDALVSGVAPDKLKIFLQQCPWKALKKSKKDSKIWTTRYVMHLWENKDENFESKSSSVQEKVKYLGDELLNALKDAIAHWLPPPNVFKSYSAIDDRASALINSLIVSQKENVNTKKAARDEGLADEEEEEDDIEIKQKEDERRSADFITSKKKVEMDVRIEQGQYKGYFSNTMHRIKDIPSFVLNGIDNLWSKDEHERAVLAQLMTFHYKAQVEMEVQQYIDKYDSILASIQALNNQDSIDTLRRANIIGMTITGASTNQAILREVKPPIILVEEAAEVLEPQLMGLLGPWLERLILIGDHKQLKPPVESFRLARDFHFDISMMERLINNDYPHATLQKQNRMLPEIASLLEDIYPKLESNHARVDQNRRPDFTNPIYFWDHNDIENSTGRSFNNKKEAERALALAQLFIKQGFEPPEITILCAYRGQTGLIRKMYRNQFPDPKSSKGNDDISEKRDTRNDVVIQTIDNYQGEENAIVIVSLVRCNDEGNIGFLKSLNRRCVAQSRAKSGMYFIGSASTLRGSRNSNWNSLLDQLSERELIGYSFPIHCPVHPLLSVISAINMQDIPAMSICTISCAKLMGCEVHKCMELCQPPHDHSQSCCRKIVDFIYSCGHPGRRQCRIPEDTLSCKRPCEGEMSCGHKCERHCQPDHSHSNLFCSVLVDFIPDCGHPCEKECRASKYSVRCKEKCSKTMDDCGHPCKRKCGLPHLHTMAVCQVDVKFTFEVCGHEGKKECGRNESELRCTQVVPFKHASCGHDGERKCYQAPASIRCKEKCSRTMECGHMCTGTCGDKCNVLKCSTCKKIRDIEAQKRREAEEKLREAARGDAWEEMKQISKRLKKADVKNSIEEIRPNGDTASEYWDVEDRVKKYIQPGHNWFPNVGKIEKVTNLNLYRNWLRAKSTMVDPTRSELKFHGTTKDSIDNIVKGGFKEPRKPGMFGFGIYFATDSSKSAQQKYTKGSDKILLCDVLVGRSLTLDSAQNTLDYQQIKDKGYDSVFARRGSERSGGVRYDEYVIYRPSQAFPKYIVHFTRCSAQDTKFQLDQLEQTAINNGSNEHYTMVPKRTFDMEDPLDVHYRLAESQFLRLKRKNASMEITSIEYCITPVLVERFRKKQQEFKKKYVGTSEADTVLAFHGTPVENIDSIIRENFKLEKCRRFAYGKGIYFSEFPDVSEDYARSSKKLILCHILPGKSRPYRAPVFQMSRSDWPMGDYDSVIVEADEQGRGKMVIIAEPDQILPSYIITYS